ncbi:MAG: DUF4114 domain-containing protein [Planctomycetota bacterium]
MRNIMFVAAVPALATGVSSAQTTDIRVPNIFERSQSQILNDALGQSFTRIGDDLVGSSITAARLSDDADQIWSAGTYSVSIIGRESLFNKKFGITDVQGDGFDRILRTTSGPTQATVTIDDNFAWAVKNSALFGGKVYSSIDDNNRDDADHMVSYNLLEGGESLGFVLFFEDWGGHASDRDFNDLAVVVQLVPLPQASLLAAAALGGLACVRRR